MYSGETLSLKIICCLYLQVSTGPSSSTNKNIFQKQIFTFWCHHYLGLMLFPEMYRAFSGHWQWSVGIEHCSSLQQVLVYCTVYSDHKIFLQLIFVDNWTYMYRIYITYWTYINILYIGHICSGAVAPRGDCHTKCGFNSRHILNCTPACTKADNLQCTQCTVYKCCQSFQISATIRNCIERMKKLVDTKKRLAIDQNAQQSLSQMHRHCFHCFHWFHDHPQPSPCPSLTFIDSHGRDS